MENEKMIEQLLADNKKKTLAARITAFAAVGIFLLVAAAFLMIVPQAVHTLENMDEILVSAKETVTQISEMSSNITTTSTNLNTFISDNAQTLTDAVANLNSIDYDTLNQAITDLQTAVEPFANLMGRFK